jgi:hypothetical protein
MGKFSQPLPPKLWESPQYIGRKQPGEPFVSAFGGGIRLARKKTIARDFAY